jgi:hypothetical protein
LQCSLGAEVHVQLLPQVLLLLLLLQQLLLLLLFT